MDPERLARLETIIEAWTRGLRTAVIIQLQKDKWNVSEATAYRDFREAQDELAKIVHEKRDDLIGRSVGLTDGIIRASMNDKDFDIAIKALKHRDEILGLTGKVELSGPNGGAIPIASEVKFGNEELKAIIAVARDSVKKRVTGK